MAAMPAVGFGPHQGPAVPPQHGVPPQPTGPGVPPPPMSSGGPALPPPPIAPNGPGLPPYAPTGTPVPPVGYGYPGHPGHPNPQGFPNQGFPNPQGFPTPQGYPAPHGYPQPSAYGWPGGPMGPVPQNSAGTAAMVLGILSVVLFCLYGVFSIALGVIAVVLGFKGRNRADRGEATNRSQAQAGIVLGAIGTVVGLATLAFMIVMYFLVAGADRPDDDWDSDPGDSSYNSAPYAPVAPALASPRV
ncbi:DUF4190 domain-containing protein [Streptomyces sp. NPDC046860]|uniref:DUF4190 domain-containing protein n=1 Tax=Streptomyces sp. NPDC046860 TaxID=3154495 RepID=UPI0033FBF497